MDLDYSSAVLDEIARSYAAGGVGNTRREQSEAALLDRPVSAEPSEAAASMDHGERMASILEANSSGLRRNMMDFYREMRATYLSAQRHAIDAERRSATVQLQSKQVEIETLKDDVAVAHNRVQDQQISLERACHLVAFYTERLQNWHLLISYFRLWKRNHRTMKREARLEEKAQTWHQEWVRRNTLRSWWFNAVRSMRAHVRSHMDTAAQRATSQVAAEKDAEITALRHQLLDTRRALAAEKAARESHAADMKRSFMRGICALNMEAMQVMKHGGDAAGADLEAASRAPPYGEGPCHTAQSDAGDPEPEAIPENIQNMMAALNIAPGASAPGAALPGSAVVKSGSSLTGYAIRAGARSPLPGVTAAAAMAGRLAK